MITLPVTASAIHAAVNSRPILFPNPIVHEDIHAAHTAGVISRIINGVDGNAATNTNGGLLWNGRLIAEYSGGGVAGYNDGVFGLSINVPAGTALVWVRTLDLDRWNCYKAYFYATPAECLAPPSNKVIGHFAHGYDKSWLMTPDNAHDSRWHESAHDWQMIPVPPALQAAGGKLALIPKGTPIYLTGNVNNFWFSGVAFSGNALGLTRINGIALHWNAEPYPGRQQLKSGAIGDTSGSSISWGATGDYSHYCIVNHATVPGVGMLPLADTGKDKALIFEHLGQDGRNLTAPESVFIEDVAVDRPRNNVWTPYTTLHLGKRTTTQFSVTRIPAALCAGKKWLQVKMLTSNGGHAYLRGVTIHDW